MIRIEEEEGWTLISHRDHAALAGAIAARWGNAQFCQPRPRSEVLLAASRHDDAWGECDRSPRLSEDRTPMALSRNGPWRAPGSVLPEVLSAHSKATEVVAADNPYAAALISMLSVSLMLADPGLDSEEQALRQAFAEKQGLRQRDFCRLAGADPHSLHRPFEWLQACDQLSLLLCQRPEEARPLGPVRASEAPAKEAIALSPVGRDVYRLSPYPFDSARVAFDLPCRRMKAKTFHSEEHFRAEYAFTPTEYLNVRLVR